MHFISNFWMFFYFDDNNAEYFFLNYRKQCFMFNLKYTFLVSAFLYKWLFKLCIVYLILHTLYHTPTPISLLYKTHLRYSSNVWYNEHHMPKSALHVPGFTCDPWPIPPQANYSCSDICLFGWSNCF